MFKIPPQFTQGDRITWQETFADYDPLSDTLTCFLRGASSLDLTGVPDNNKWQFEISTTQSAGLTPGKYQAQFVVFGSGFGRTTLGVTSLEICPDFSILSELDNTLPEEKELAAIQKAITALSNGVAEYYIGERRIRYVELPQLYEREKYLKNRLAKIKNKGIVGGRNLPVRFFEN